MLADNPLECHSAHPSPSIQKQLLPLMAPFSAFCVFGYRHHTKSGKVGYREAQLHCYLSGEVKRYAAGGGGANALFTIAWHRPLERDLSRQAVTHPSNRPIGIMSHAQLYGSCTEVLSLYQSMEDDLAAIPELKTGFVPRIRQTCQNTPNIHNWRSVNQKNCRLGRFPNVAE